MAILEQKKRSNNNIIYLAIIIISFVLAAYFLYHNYFSPLSGDNNEALVLNETSILTPLQSIWQSNNLSFQDIDNTVLQQSNFNQATATSYVAGNPQPFIISNSK